MESKIIKLKEIEKAYQLAMDWYYREKVSEEEYLNGIGSYKDYTPEEILGVMTAKIKSL